MDVLAGIRERARKKQRRVVFPEGEEPRTIAAAGRLTGEQLARVTLIGRENIVSELLGQHDIDLSLVSIVDPQASSSFESYVEQFMELRREKRISYQEASKTIADPLFFGAMLVRDGLADASVAGAIHASGEVVKAGLQVLGLKPGIKTVSGSFLMLVPRLPEPGGVPYMFGDCAVLPKPTPAQLASIAVSTAETIQSLLGLTPRVALLSFSTKGSANHEEVDKVVEALDILKRDHPQLQVDGELQVDAAIIPEIARHKAPGSATAGRANVLIFPNLDAGNIGYKLVQRMAGATALGPIIQGLTKPANDLSRGCSVDDIVNVTAITSLMVSEEQSTAIL